MSSWVTRLCQLFQLENLLPTCFRRLLGVQTSPPSKEPPATAFKSIKVLDFDYTYLDSGPPASPNYATWVFIHGMGFNGGAFKKLLPLAAAHNVRIVAINRRGYSPSSGFQDHELAVIGFGKKIEEAGPFFRGQGTEIATFLVNFATEQCIPLADHSSSTGGIVLVGWSIAATHTTATLAYLDELPDATRSSLQKYLHTVLYHDAPGFALGIPDADRHDLVGLLSVHNNDTERFNAFFHWVTGHFLHKSVTSGNMDDLVMNIPADVPHSLHELSHEQRTEYTNMQAFLPTGCDGKLPLCDATVYATLARRALFDKARAEKFPDLRVRFMSSGTSDGVFVWAAWTLRKCAENPLELYGSDAEKARDIKVINQTEGNHFVFWDEPEKAIQQYSASINL